MKLRWFIVVMLGLSGVGYAQSYSCGLPGVSGNQSCFNTSTSIVPLPNPIPAWGANSTTTAAGNPYVMQTVGNSTGAGTSVTPSDFGRPIIRCTDSTFFGGIVWGLADNGEPNLFAPDDSAFIAKESGGNRVIIAINPLTGLCVPVSGITITGGGGAVWSHSSTTTLYTLSGTNSSIVSSQPITISCSPTPIVSGSTCSGSLGSPTVLKDFADANCITNSYNGNPSWTLGTGGTGSFTDSGDDTTFAMVFSDHNVTGQKNRWLVVWRTTYGGGNGCNIWDLESGKYQKYDGTQGVVSITPPVNAADTLYGHEGFTTLGNTYAIVNTGTQNTMIVGTYYPQNYLWQFETANVVHQGYPSPAPINGNSINGTLTSGTFTTSETVTQTSTGAQGSVVTPSGGTVGFTNNGTVLQLGTITGSPDASHTWVGGSSGAIFTPSAAPALNPTANNGWQGHFAEGYTLAVSGKGGNVSPYATPNTIGASLTPNGAPCSDLHMSWNFDNATDDYPFMVTSQDYFTFANLAQLQTTGSNSVCPSPPTGSGFAGMPLYYNELYFSKIPSSGSGSVLRVAHTFNSGWEASFDQQIGGVGLESSSGKWAMFLTDAYGQFGSTSGGSSCLVGGPDWTKNDSQDFVTGSGFGSFIMPQNGGNTNNSVYQIQSCSGSPCATATTLEPNFGVAQSVGNTISESAGGNITWINVGVQNCRAELMLVKLFDLGAQAGVSGKVTLKGNVVTK